MLPEWHGLYGFVFSYILVYFFHFPLSAGIIIFLASTLIDLDHYFMYILKNRNYNFIKFVQLNDKETKRFRKLSAQDKFKYKVPYFPFHGVEFWLVIFILSFYYKVFFWIFIGIVFHMIQDFIDMYYHKDPFFIKISQIYVFIKNKNKKEFV